MMDVDLARVGASEVADQFLMGWRTAVRVFGKE